VEMKFLTMIFLLGLSVTCAAQLDRNYSSMTMEELEALPEDEIKRIPFDIAMSKIEDIPAEVFEMMLFMPLRALMYGDIDKESLRSMVHDFQLDVGDTPTGRLTIGQFDELIRRHEQLDRTKVYSSGYASIYIYGDFALWAISNGMDSFSSCTEIFRFNEYAIQSGTLRCRKVRRSPYTDVGLQSTAGTFPVGKYVVNVAAGDPSI